MARIYVASSWRNAEQPEVVEALRRNGHQVYDFRNPGGIDGAFDPADRPCPTRTAPGLRGFQWSQLDPNWKNWTPEQYRAALLSNPIASHGFNADFRAMRWADTCVLLLPSGRSAHLEAGWMAGAGKRVIVLLREGDPELMNLLLDDLCMSMGEVLACLSE